MSTIADISQVLVAMNLIDATDAERAVVDFALTAAEGAVMRYLGYDPVYRSRTEMYPIGNYKDLSGGIFWDTSGDQAVQERYGLHSEDLFVKHIPIRRVTNLWINYDGKSISNRFTSDHLKTQASSTASGDYWVLNNGLDDNGNEVGLTGVIKNDGSWPTTQGTVKINYTAGYTDDEFNGNANQLNARPILDAVVNEAIRRALKTFLTQKSNTGFSAGPVKSERLGDYSYTIGLTEKALDRLYGGSADVLPETALALQDFVNWGYRIAA